MTTLLEGLSQGLSIFNTIAFLWLGLTVLFNADRRTWGSWVAGGGLVAAGLFFGVHSALFARGPTSFRGEMASVWPLSWLPFVGLPYVWYAVMAWYAGVLRSRRHRIGLVGAGLMGIAALALLLALGPLPPRRDPGPGVSAVFAYGGLGITVLLYAGYSVGCIGLSLLALRRPRGSERFMGEVARRRALPWLIATALVLLLVSVAVTGLVASFLTVLATGNLARLTGAAVSVVDAYDLAITGLFTAMVLLVGRAIVSYEIFTGKVLPRGGLRRQWRNSLVVAGGFGLLTGGGLAIGVDPVILLVLAGLLITVVFAIHSWRVYAEREETMARLRPFVTSEQLYDRLLEATSEPDTGLEKQFRALCGDVLEARVAFLIPIGPHALLGGSPLTHPAGAGAPARVQIEEVAERFGGPEMLCIPIEPSDFAQSVWAVPLWSERGLIGCLLLGEKRDGALYTQEEIELGRASGERMLDTLASAEMSRRLMSLQRVHLTETLVVDRRGRRLLHDDVLPRLHAVLLSLSAESERTEVVEQAVKELVGVHQQVAGLLRASPPALAPEVGRLGVIGALREAVEVEFGGDFDDVEWSLDEEAHVAGRALSATTAEVVFYAAREAVRNAARHARGNEAGSLRLTVSARVCAGTLAVTVEDSGVGFGEASPAALSDGHGLALHSTMMAVVGGSLTTESEPHRRTRVRLSVPLGVPVTNDSLRVAENPVVTSHATTGS